MASDEHIVVGVDVGATKVQIGSLNTAGQVLKTEKYLVNRSSREHILASIHSAIDCYLENWNGNKPIAIGIGFPGNIDPETGVVLRSKSLLITEPYPLGSLIKNRLRMPVRVDNDVKAASLAEIRWGIGQSSQEFIFINVGTGIAASIISNGKLIRGITNYAGELGQMIVEIDQEADESGHFVSLESIASGGGLIRSALALTERFPDSVLHQKYAPHELHAGIIFQEAAAGDELAIKLERQAMRALGISLINITNLINPEHIVFGGGVLRDDKKLAYLRLFMQQYGHGGHKEALVSMKLSALDPAQVGMLGAANLALQSLVLQP